MVQSNIAGKQNQDLIPTMCSFSENGIVEEWSHQVMKGEDFNFFTPEIRGSTEIE